MFCTFKLCNEKSVDYNKLGENTLILIPKRLMIIVYVIFQ